jgi:hypothetical protein
VGSDGLLGRRRDPDLPAIFLEHNTPRRCASTRHPLADEPGFQRARHPFQRSCWDCGRTPTQ